MSKKPRKLRETKAPYAAKKRATRGASSDTSQAETEFLQITGKLLSERKELLRKLAQ